MTPDDRLIAVTGATGVVGSATAAFLSEAGARTRLVVRDPGVLDHVAAERR